MRGDAHVLVAQHPRQAGGKPDAETGGQRRAGPVVQIGQLLQPGPAQSLFVLVGQFQRCDRQAAQGGAGDVCGENAAGSVSGQGPRGLGRVSQGAPDFESGAFGPSLDRLHQSPFAAEQMGAAGDVQHQAVRRIQRDHWAEAAEILHQPGQKGGVRLGPMDDGAQGGRPRPGVGQGQTRGQACLRRRWIDRRQPQRALDFFDEDDRRGLFRQRGG
jgi:hypothetical protein